MGYAEKSVVSAAAVAGACVGVSELVFSMGSRSAVLDWLLTPVFFLPDALLNGPLKAFRSRNPVEAIGVYFILVIATNAALWALAALAALVACRHFRWGLYRRRPG
jgi:hypothetical protein